MSEENLKTDVISLAELLQRSSLKIPLYQRPYKWSVKNVIQLLDDIERFKATSAYRIGTIVIHEKDNILNIVDGQQRTLTFLLIAKALYTHKLNQINCDVLKGQLISINENAFKPSFQNEISKNNIQANYREIERKIVGFDEKTICFFLNNCQLTLFVIDDDSEAFQFFDSQNARGRDLEPHDLLKAFHLRELESASEEEITKLVTTWEAMDMKELSALFADFLYRVRGWSKGNPSRYFTKQDTSLFKGVNLNRIENYPYIQLFKLVDNHIHQSTDSVKFPFQLDQTIINGKYFFEMVSHYQNKYREITSYPQGLSEQALEILTTLDNYEGRNRTGDKYVRMLFNCALIYYVDKFGENDLSKAIEKIFIWAYSIRLNYQSLQIATVDNYVVEEQNLFKKIREAIYKDDILTMELPLVQDDYESDKTAKIKDLFIKMRYYASRK